MPNGGEIIVEYLARERVPYVFGLCVYDRTDAIKTISTRHEQTAGHMADAYFRVAHRPELGEALKALPGGPAAVFDIGDCAVPRTAFEAMQEAAALGHRL